VTKWNNPSHELSSEEASPLARSEAYNFTNMPFWSQGSSFSRSSTV
jgi:hypothetical protein